MKNFLKNKIMITLLLSILVSACSDLLDQEPQGEWVRGDEGSSGSFQSDVFTLYAKLRGFHVTSGSTALAIHSFRSEDAEKGSTASDGAAHGAMYDDFEYIATNGLIGSYWTDNYEIIHLSNSILHDIEEAEKGGVALSDGDQINKSEAHFFRAFAFFNLVRAFGDVPKIDFKIADAAEANIPKSPATEIYQLIDADLTAAETHLPRVWPPVFVGRLTWGAARALHARTYMMRNDWNNMYAAATDVIQSGIYNLNTPYNQIFRETGENSSESVLELQCTATASQPATNDLGSQFAQVQGVRGAGDWNLGWGWNTPTELLAGAFETGDPRKDETLLYFYKTGGDPASIPANQPYNEKPMANADVINKYYNKKAYTNPALRITYSKSGYWYNIRIIRYADVVLMAAEAANETGKTNEAIDYLEMVRARARGNNNSILPKVTTTDQAELQNAIRHERRVELGMEFDRFYDLVRWGIARDVLHAAGKINYQDKHALLPLPQNEVDKSNGVLKQNPNY
ncbi:RagB/SusD family nutrient uptake outer membrane protein [Proteiniphilum sp.]|uniref:RagB/SusD family nutrient uptake outer membrane protein n=1 Tax=Proteiniphilum sp. TaxID=1926877 RepID=UPI002B1EFEB1|nr:RagB/SusD family nutrient uptake outer membrane protein [Proteiniphilum sp.]MEA4919039.1 RagB/SusD family nutrient uptake outer membrane protein [Proteiniphilum sp.]